MKQHKYLFGSDSTIITDRERMLIHDPSPLQNNKWSNAYWVQRRLKEVLSNEGLQACLKRVVYKLYRILCGQASLLPFPLQDLKAQYQVWQQQQMLIPEALAAQCDAVKRMPYQPLVSVVILVNRANEGHLDRAIESVQAQAYSHWELRVICDSFRQVSIEELVDSYMAVDARVKFQAPATTETTGGFDHAALQPVSGEFLCFLAPDAELTPDALLAVVEQLNETPDTDLLYFDEDVSGLKGEGATPFFKPGWSPDLLLATNYIGQNFVLRTKMLSSIADSWSDIYAGEFYHLILRFTEETDKILRIPRVLCHFRTPTVSVAMPSNGGQPGDGGGVKALQKALIRRGEQGEVACIGPGRFRVNFLVRGTPLVSIIIPTRDHGELLKQCIASIEGKTRYAQYEILVLDNGSAAPEALRYLDTVAEKWPVYRYPGPFNFSSINNAGVGRAKGEYLLFLNNDVEVISPDWMTTMVAQAQRPGVGAVGAKLLYPDGSIQHAGVVLGIDGGAGHAFRHSPFGTSPYYGLADVVRNCSAVTAACMMVPKEVFMKIQGFDERLRIEFNDVDLCLRIKQQGYRIVYAPEAVLRHHENATRKGGRSWEDKMLFAHMWDSLIKKGDPYYNPNLTLSREDWSLNV